MFGSVCFFTGVGLGAVFPRVPKPSQKKRLGKLRPQFTGSTETCQRYFQAIYKSKIEMIPLNRLSRVVKRFRGWPQLRHGEFLCADWGWTLRRWR